MIVGHGSLAKLLKDREDAILFASGVGDSNCKDNYQFARESNTLTSNYFLGNYYFRSQRALIYFSTISIYLYDTPYTRHKKNMERIVRDCYENYCIIRLGNIWQCTNPNTFLNYLRAHPEAEVRENEIKYMIDADTLNMVVHSLPLTGKHEISVFTEMLTVKECLSR